MSITHAINRVLLFVVLVGVVTGGWAVFLSETDGRPPPGRDLGDRDDRRSMGSTGGSAFDTEGVLLSDASPSGRVRLESRSSGKLVLVDTEHDNGFSDADIQPLVSALTRNGHTVRFYNEDTAEPGGLTNALRNADAFVVIDPGERFTVNEVQAVDGFANRGGRVLLVAEPLVGDLDFFGVRISEVSGGTALASEFGMSLRAGYLYTHDDDAVFRTIDAESRGSGPLQEGVDRVALHGVAPITHWFGSTVLATGTGTTLSTTRERGRYPVMVRKGNVVAIGDSSVFYPENYRTADNEVLVGNVADFLVTGRKGARVSRAVPGQRGTNNTASG